MRAWATMLIKNSIIPFIIQFVSFSPAQKIFIKSVRGMKMTEENEVEHLDFCFSLSPRDVVSIHRFE